VSKYIESKIDGKTYCVSNGQFARYLRTYHLTYQEYYETYVTGKKEFCPYCENERTFSQKNHSYSKTCGSNDCYGKLIKDIKSNFSDEKNKKINEKRAKTNLKKYGNEVATNSSSILAKKAEKRKDIMEDGRTRGEHQQEAARNGKLKKYGNENYNNSKKASETRKNKSVEEKAIESRNRRKTLLERYGVENIFQLPQSTNRVAKGNSSIKEFEFPSKRTIGVRGYEPEAINILLENYSENDFLVSNSYDLYGDNMPVFEYIDSNQHRKKYFPDIFIPKENRIIEVKSKWWYDANGRPGYESRLINNQKKMKAAVDSGYEFEFWVFDDRDNYMVIK
jgi:hypothetical protein